MKILVSTLVLSLFLAVWFAANDIQNLKIASCFGLNNSSSPYDKYVDDIKKNEKIILEPYNQGYFSNFEQLKKNLYYDIYLYNGLKTLIKVSNPEYEKMHQITLRDQNDEAFVIRFSETKKIENYVRVDEIRKRNLIGALELETPIQVAPGSIFVQEYNPVNGVACFIAEPKGDIRFPLFVNILLNFVKYWYK